jgi:hypothetical protein
MKLYFNKRQEAALNDPRNINRVPRFNNAFIASMSKDERVMDVLEELLDEKTGDPRMLAAFAPDSLVNRAFLSQFSSTQKRPVVSPVSQSITDYITKDDPSAIEFSEATYRKMFGDQAAGQEPEQTGQYSIGQVIEHGGKRYKIVGFFPDGEPDVVEVR